MPRIRPKNEKQRTNRVAAKARALVTPRASFFDTRVMTVRAMAVDTRHQRPSSSTPVAIQFALGVQRQKVKRKPPGSGFMEGSRGKSFAGPRGRASRPRRWRQ